MKLDELRAKVQTATLVPPPNDYPEPVRHEWRMMAEARWRNPAISNRELAKGLGYGYHTILAWSRDPRYQRYENYLIKKELDNAPPSSLPKKSVRDLISEYEVDMAQKLIDIAEHTTDERLAADIAQDLLDRAGHGARNKEGGRPIVINIGADMVENFTKRAKEAGLLPDGNTFDQSPG